MHTRTEQRVRGSDKTHPTNTLTNRVLESNSLLCLAPAIPAIGTSPFVSFVNGVSHNHKSHSHIHKQLPQDGEHHTLQSIRQNPCLKASSKQSSPSMTASTDIKSEFAVLVTLRLPTHSRPCSSCTVGSCTNGDG